MTLKGPQPTSLAAATLNSYWLPASSLDTSYWQSLMLCFKTGSADFWLILSIKVHCMVYSVIGLLGGLGGFQDKVTVVLVLSFCVTLNSSGSDGSVIMKCI